MSTTYKPTTKTDMRLCVKNSRSFLRMIEQAINAEDWETLETLSRSLEAQASLLASDAVSRSEAL